MFQGRMNETMKVLVFVAILLVDIFNGEARRSHDKYKAFKNCRSKACAPRVSFCIIMKDCGCGGSSQPGEFCHCCEDCFRCVGAKKWLQCCECVGLCGQVSVNITGNGLRIPSKFGDLPNSSLPTLFEAMSTVSNLPLAFISRPRKGGLMKQVPSSHRHQCKVAFFDKCFAREVCRKACSNMGASRYRWFRNGCCQCIGKRCHDYGELTPLCKDCAAT